MAKKPAPAPVDQGLIDARAALYQRNAAAQRKVERDDVFLMTSGEVERRRRVRRALKQDHSSLAYEATAREGKRLMATLSEEFEQHEEARVVSAAEQRERYAERQAEEAEALEEMIRARRGD